MESFETLQFFRGVSARVDPSFPSVHEVRKDRKPRDAAPAFHKIADDWFNAKFGIRYRSQALFVTSREFTAKHYATSDNHVMRIVPLTEYRYCWSPQVIDLLFLSKQVEQKSVAEIQESLVALDYREDGLAQAHAKGHEVMLFCDRYIAIPIVARAIIEAPRSEPASIIIPGFF
jgi:hypothetical protein